MTGPWFAPLRWLGLPALALAVAACDLGEVTTAPAADLLVVESILRAGASRQILLLHRSLQTSNDGISPVQEVPGEPGATVVVRASNGEVLAFSEAPLEACTDGLDGPAYLAGGYRVGATCFTSSRAPLWVAPGSTYELDVLTRDGLRIRGRTSVPGDFTLQQGASTCSLPPSTNLPLAWTVAEGAWSYIATMQINGLSAPMAAVGITAPDRLQLTAVSVSQSDTTLRVPADFGIFDFGNVSQDILKFLQNGFPPGVSVYVTIAAADRNYVNAVRGGAFNPSGNIRLSSVVGEGVGVFGSMIPRSFEIHVGSGLSLRSCLQ